MGLLETCHRVLEKGSRRDVSPMKSLVILLVVLCSIVLGSLPAVEKEAPQRIVPVPRGQFTEQEQESALRTLGGVEKSVVSFVTYLPEVSSRIWRSDPKSRHTRVDLTLRIRDAYIINLWFDAVFDEKFTKVVESHCEMFGVIVLADAAKLKPGEAGRPLVLSLDEMDALCDDWEALIAAKRKAPDGKKS